jgi:hypothetical protein
MNSLKILAVVIGLVFTMSVANTNACDKHKTSAKSECSSEMQKTSAKADAKSGCCTTTKTASVKADGCSTTKTASAKSECCSSKKGAKLEAANTGNKDVKTAEVKPISN